MAVRMAEVWNQQGMAHDEVRDRALLLINRAFDILELGLPYPHPAADFMFFALLSKGINRPSSAQLAGTSALPVAVSSVQCSRVPPHPADSS